MLTFRLIIFNVLKEIFREMEKVNTDSSRCGWGNSEEIYIEYHDHEWGVQVHDDKKLFEFLTLESFQSGLSWLTILKKRENFRKAFNGFDPIKVAKYGEKEIILLMGDSGIIRNLQKIKAAINNAQRFLEIQKEFGSFDKFIWSFTNYKTIINQWKNNNEIPAKTNLSDEIAADMKKRGFKFIGSTVLYSHIQATGMVNDHLVSCFRYKEINHNLGKD
jgi:DNA-3-methyladenine glycosylase I